MPKLIREAFDSDFNLNENIRVRLGFGHQLFKIHFTRLENKPQNYFIIRQ